MGSFSRPVALVLLSLLTGSGCATLSPAPPAPPPPPPAPIPLPPPPPPPPPPPASEGPVEISYCVVQGGKLTGITLQYNTSTGDTIYQGQPVTDAFPVTTSYAGGETWYLNNEAIAFSGGRYTKFGLPRVLGPSQLRPAGQHQGIPVFVEAEANSLEVIYIPTRPGCEFQPYEREEAEPRPVAPFHQNRHPRAIARREGEWAAQTRAIAQAAVAIERIRAALVTAGQMIIDVPATWVQGRRGLVTITLSREPGVPHRQVYTDTLRVATAGGSPVVQQRIRIVDTLSVSNKMRARLYMDTVNTPTFVHEPMQDTIFQSLRSGPAKWSFRATPLRTDTQNLDISVERQVEEDGAFETTSLGPYSISVVIEADTHFKAERFFYKYVWHFVTGGGLLAVMGLLLKLKGGHQPEHED